MKTRVRFSQIIQADEYGCLYALDTQGGRLWHMTRDGKWSMLASPEEPIADAEPKIKIISAVHNNEECDVQWTEDGMVWKRSLARGEDAIICAVCLSKLRPMAPEDSM